MPVKKFLFSRLTQIGAFLLAGAMAFLSAPAANAAAGNNGLKIILVAGAGGLTGATYRQDTIILFNPTQGPLPCTACAIQSHSATDNTGSWTVYKLPSFTLPAGGYYMISGSAVTYTTVGDVAPIPYDYQLKTLEGTTAKDQNTLSSTAGVLALTSTQTALSSSSSTTVCGTGSQLLDIVGFGSSYATNGTTKPTPSVCYAGSGPAYYDGSNAGHQLTAVRKNKCIDTFNNSNDFANYPIFYANSATTPTPCPTGTQLSATITASPNNPGVTEATIFTSTVTPATSPASTGITAYVNFDSPYYSGSALLMNDSGTNGDTTAGDGIYSLLTAIPSTTLGGATYPTSITVSDVQGNRYIAQTALPVTLGTITVTSPTTTGTTTPGGVLTFPVSITSYHGYTGILAVTCAGTPNANSLGVPVNTQCVSTPVQINISSNGTASTSVAIATGTTISAGAAPTSWKWGVAVILCIGLATFGVWRRKRIFLPILLLAVSVLTLSTTACETNAGMSNTLADPGTYTYTVTFSDANTLSVMNTISFTVVVQ